MNVLKFHRHLRYSVADRRYSQRTQTAVRFRDHDAPHGLSPVGLVFQITGQFLQKRFYLHSAFYGVKVNPVNPVNARTASVGLNQSPCMMEDIFTADLVVECVKAIGRFAAVPWYTAFSVAS